MAWFWAIIAGIAVLVMVPTIVGAILAFMAVVVPVGGLAILAIVVGIAVYSCVKESRK